MVTMRNFLLLGVIAADVLLISDCFILTEDDVVPVFPDLPAPFIPTLGVIAANGLMPLLRATLLAMETAFVIAVFITGGQDRRKRSTSEELANLLLSAVSRLDTHGCILKLLCQLEAESPDALSVEERRLVEAFADRLELFAEGSGVEEAHGGDGQGRDGALCDAPADRCPFGGAVLRSVWRRVSGSVSGLWENNAPTVMPGL
ncbi:uncharacterized protein LOC125026889 [Penaeus chinensis]|uniref:uncharacterized protein LOC125026889 n=1 Tax=Penaeus chinensis TaxID=139456 RepID=UPI001FB57B6E|nr:uncharacterized protein LOC125026889 [Penaeus chinensis]